VNALNRVLAYLTAAALCFPVGQAGFRVWQQFYGELAPEGPASGPASTPTGGGASAARLPVDRVAEWDLFGRAAPVNTAPVTAPTEAPKTRLQLTLRGVAASKAGEDAHAIIADPSGRERRYRQGEAVPGGASLAEVHENRVLLLRNGRYETLPLAKVEGAAPGDAGGAGLGPAAFQRRLPLAPPPPPPPAPEADQVEEPPVEEAVPEEPAAEEAQP